MRIYTRGGDSGETGLFGGKRVPKHDARVRAYGDVDELSAVLGWCAVAADGVQSAGECIGETAPTLREQLQREQQHLMTLGAYLSTPADAKESILAHLPNWPTQVVETLEAEIDAMDAQLEPLTDFILPGGNELSARLHIARTVCRRAEREVCALGATAAGDAQLKYLNRLSDWLFTAARATAPAA